jgi:hypothetical protein
MPSEYQIKVKAPALDALKAAREKVRVRIGTSRIGENLVKLTPTDAQALGNELLALLDAIEAVTSRAKALD